MQQVYKVPVSPTTVRAWQSTALIYLHLLYLTHLYILYHIIWIISINTTVCTFDHEQSTPFVRRFYYFWHYSILSLHFIIENCEITRWKKIDKENITKDTPLMYRQAYLLIETTPIVQNKCLPNKSCSFIHWFLI